MRGKLISVAVSTALAFSLTACGGGSSSGSEDSVKQEVTVESSSISYALTSVYSGVEQSQRGSVGQREVKIYTGELVSENVKTGENKTYNWSAYVNDETFEVTSNKTVIIEPGDYHFTLNLTNGSNQYISETDHTITDRNQTNIPFNLKPVLGSVITDVSVIEEIPAMKLKYDVGEISAYSQPRVAIGVDKEIQYLDINPTTGLSDVYLAIEEGDHNITLDFYDGNQYLGRSSKYPSNVTITAKQDLNIDLVALHGEATLGFDVNESTLDVVVNIPSQVVVESEGIDNLSTLLRYSDSNVTVEKEIVLEADGRDATGNITLEDISYGEFAFSLIFSDKNDNDELIGSCDVEPFILSENNSSVNCELSLKKRSNITGNLLATVGINVFNETMEPMAGAELYINDDYLGLTGSGDFGTEGYLKQYIKKGNYTLKAQKDDRQGRMNIDLSALSLNNFDIILNGCNENNTSLSSLQDSCYSDTAGATVNVSDLLGNSNVTFTKESDYWVTPTTYSISKYDNSGNVDVNIYITDDISKLPTTAPDGSVAYITSENSGAIQGDSDKYEAVFKDGAWTLVAHTLKDLLDLGSEGSSYWSLETQSNFTNQGYATSENNNSFTYWEDDSSNGRVMTKGDRSDLPIATNPQRENLTAIFGDDPAYTTEGVDSSYSYNVSYLKQWFYSDSSSPEVTNSMLDGIPCHDSTDYSDSCYANETALNVGRAITPTGKSLELTTNAQGANIWHEGGNKDNVLLVNRDEYWDLSGESTNAFDNIAGINPTVKLFYTDIMSLSGDGYAFTREDGYFNLPECSSRGMRMPKVSEIQCHSYYDSSLTGDSSNGGSGICGGIPIHEGLMSSNISLKDYSNVVVYRKYNSDWQSNSYYIWHGNHAELYTTRCVK